MSWSSSRKISQAELNTVLQNVWDRAKVNNAAMAMTLGWLPKVSAKQYFLSELLGNSPSQTSMSQTPVTHWLTLKENSYFTFSVIRATLHHSISNGMTILSNSAAVSPTSWNQISPMRYKNNAGLKFHVIWR